MDANSTLLKSALGEKYSSMSQEIGKAGEIKTAFESKTINILNVPILKESLQNSIGIAKNVLLILYEELKAKEESIESLLPVEDSFWEKNITLTEQTALAIEKISVTEKNTLNQMMQYLPTALSFVEPCLWTLTQYNVKNELLLNYPVAKTAIEDMLKKKKQVSVQDLPFRAQDAEEYLKLYFNERNREFVFNEESLLLSRRT